MWEIMATLCRDFSFVFLLYQHLLFERLAMPLFMLAVCRFRQFAYRHLHDPLHVYSSVHDLLGRKVKSWIVFPRHVFVSFSLVLCTDSSFCWVYS